MKRVFVLMLSVLATLQFVITTMSMLPESVAAATDSQTLGKDYLRAKQILLARRRRLHQIRESINLNKVTEKDIFDA